MWIIIAVLLVLVLFMTFSNGGITGAVVQAASAGAKSTSSSYSGMVGGC